MWLQLTQTMTLHNISGEKADWKHRYKFVLERNRVIGEVDRIKVGCLHFWGIWTLFCSQGWFWTGDLHHPVQQQERSLPPDQCHDCTHKFTHIQNTKGLCIYSLQSETSCAGKNQICAVLSSLSEFNEMKEAGCAGISFVHITWQNLVWTLPHWSRWRNNETKKNTNDKINKKLRLLQVSVVYTINYKIKEIESQVSFTLWKERASALPCDSDPK